MPSTAPPVHHTTLHVQRVPPTHMQPLTAHHPQPNLPPERPPCNVCLTRPCYPATPPRHTHTHTLQTHPIPPYHKHHTAPRHLTPHVNTTHHYHQAFSNSSALPATHLSNYQVYFLSIRWFVSGLFLSRPVYTPPDIFYLSGPFLLPSCTDTHFCLFPLGSVIGNPACTLGDVRHLSGSFETILIFGVVT